MFDNGSNVFQIVDKADDIVLLFNHIELLQNKVAKFILNYWITSKEDYDFLRYLTEVVCNNLMALFYHKVQSSKYAPSQADLELLETRIQGLTDKLPSQPEFIVYGSNRKYLLLSEARIYARLVECYFWKLLRALKNHNLGYTEKRTAKFLNALSDYFMVLSRYENKNNIETSAFLLYAMDNKLPLSLVIAGKDSLQQTVEFYWQS
jgi:cob(I)alamin adenosyltransferase